MVSLGEPDQGARIPGLEQIFFETHIDGYQSLEISVGIAGLQQLANVFDGNFELFLMFLNAYVPDAFNDTLYRWDIRDKFRYEVVPDKETNLAFDRIGRDSSTIVGEAGDSSAVGARARLAWIVANTSFVVPVILALVVLFVVYRSLDEERDLLSERMDAILARQDAIIELQNKRVASLQKLEDFLIEQFLEDAKKTVPEWQCNSS